MYSSAHANGTRVVSVLQNPFAQSSHSLVTLCHLLVLQGTPAIWAHFASTVSQAGVLLRFSAPRVSVCAARSPFFPPRRLRRNHASSTHLPAQIEISCRAAQHNTPTSSIRALIPVSTVCLPLTIGLLVTHSLPSRRNRRNTSTSLRSGEHDFSRPTHCSTSFAS